jgi:hypothetical protein
MKEESWAMLQAVKEGVIGVFLILFAILIPLASLYGAPLIACGLLLPWVLGIPVELSAWDIGLLIIPPVAYGIGVRAADKELPSLFGDPPVIGILVGLLLAGRAWVAHSYGWLVPGFVPLLAAIVIAYLVGRFLLYFSTFPEDDDDGRPTPGHSPRKRGALETTILSACLVAIPWWAMYAGPAIGGGALSYWLSAYWLSGGQLELSVWDGLLAFVPPLFYFGIAWSGRVAPESKTSTGNLLAEPAILGGFVACLLVLRVLAKGCLDFSVPGYVSLLVTLVAAVGLLRFCPNVPE